MTEFKRLLTKFKTEKGQPFTHTSIGQPKISVHVPDAEMSAFMEAYKQAMIRGTDLHMTERPKNPSPFRVDLDFRFPLQAGTTLPPQADPADETADPADRTAKQARRYTTAHVEQILLAYNRLLADNIDAPTEAFRSYVMEKPSPSEHRGKVKDGLHIVWPGLVVTNAFQHFVRKSILESATDVFRGLELCNSYDDIVDKAIIDRNNWQMYGSKKPDNPSYEVTNIYDFAPAQGALSRVARPSAALDMLDWVEMFSVRNKSTPTRLLPGKTELIDAYAKHVLPTIDERRKNKLHGQIFTTVTNLTRNLISHEEFELAKQLVQCLNPARADSYEDWIKLGWTLRNIDYRLEDAWVEFSRESTKYVEGECQKMWDRMRITSLSMGTLRWWARQDNPTRYEEIINRNVVSLIDKCAGNEGAHYDVACVVHALFKDRYQFTNRDIWYTYRDDKHRWVRTKEGILLRNVLSTKVCSEFLKRVLHWTQQAVLDQDHAESYHKKSAMLQKIALRLRSSGYKDSVMKECKCLFTDERFEELLDSHPHLIGFENGVYDLHLHQFRDGLPDDYISFSTNRVYRPYDATLPDVAGIHDFFAKVFMNKDVRRYVWDVLASILDGSIRHEKFYVCTGIGSNGKSKVVELIQRAVGDYYCILPIALLTQKRAQSNSAQSELERTKGRRFAVMQEPSEGEKINIGLMKELSGGDRIQCRGLFKEPIEFRPQFKMIMTCNELPEVPGDDNGTWRRIRVVEFKSKFCEEPNPTKPNEILVDTELADKFDRWADPFISMLIEHHRVTELKNIPEPMDVRIATESYKANNDVIGQYLGDKFVVDDKCNDRLMLRTAMSDFRTWAFNNVSKTKKMPDRTQFRAYLEKTYGPYPTDGKGWRHIRPIEALGGGGGGEGDEGDEELE